MSNIGVTYNNPGNLTVGGPNSYLYQGQSGVYNSSNGLSYAEFPDASTGTNALEQYISDNIGTNSNLLQNVQQFVGYFLNGNTSSVDNTPANPYAANYLQQVESAVGLGGSTNFTQSQVNSPSFIQALAGAVSKSEGTSSVFAPSSGSGFLSTIANDAVALNNSVLQGMGVNPASGAVSTNSAAGLVGSAASSVASAASGPVASVEAWFNGMIKSFEGGIEGFLERGAFGIIGLILLAAGIVYLVSTNKTVQQVAKTAIAA